MERLQTLMASIDAEYETGFAEGELEALLEAASFGEDDGHESIGENEDAEPKLDRAVELMQEWGTALGQLWRLPSRTAGQFHLLLCGDATDIPTVERLMAGQRAPLFATDPPYLVDYDGTNHPGKSAAIEKAKNKDWSETYKDWDNSAQGDGLYDGFVSAAVAAAVTDNAAWYCWHASRRQAMVEAVWERHGAFVHQQIIWAKDRPLLTRSWYMWQHEPCFFGWIKGKKPERVADDYPRTVWQMATTSFGDKPDHPTPKPLEVWQIPMLQHTRPGDLCYEPFSGSGSQIVAAENLGRQCRAIEIAPPYVAVALDRYLTAFGIRAELVGLGVQP
jgi:DNA modification methylase